MPCVCSASAFCLDWHAFVAISSHLIATWLRLGPRHGAAKWHPRPSPGGLCINGKLETVEKRPHQIWWVQWIESWRLKKLKVDGFKLPQVEDWQRKLGIKKSAYCVVSLRKKGTKASTQWRATEHSHNNQFPQSIPCWWWFCCIWRQVLSCSTYWCIYLSMYLSIFLSVCLLSGFLFSQSIDRSIDKSINQSSFILCVFPLALSLSPLSLSLSLSPSHIYIYLSR
jgi:hypothetical protein